MTANKDVPTLSGFPHPFALLYVSLNLERYDSDDVVVCVIGLIRFNASSNEKRQR